RSDCRLSKEGPALRRTERYRTARSGQRVKRVTSPTVREGSNDRRPTTKLETPDTKTKTAIKIRGHAAVDRAGADGGGFASDPDCFDRDCKARFAFRFDRGGGHGVCALRVLAARPATAGKG